MTPTDPNFPAAPVAAPIPAPIAQPVAAPVPHVVAPVAHVAAVAPVPVAAPQGMNHVLAAITTQVAMYAPAVLAAITMAEGLGTGATGAQKLQAAVTSITQNLEGSSNANVAGIAALANLGVFMANFFGAFKHKAPAAQ